MPSAAGLSFTGPNGQDPMEAVEKLIDNILPSSEAMIYSASRQITRIRERTEQGIDVNGSPFPAYTPAYAKRRTKLGRNASPVDLLMSGRLLNSLRVEVVSDHEFAITVMDAEAAVYGQALNDGNSRLPQRRFFDTSQSELDAMMRDLTGFDKQL